MPDQTFNADPGMPTAAIQSWTLAEGVRLKVNFWTTIELRPAYPGFWARLFGAKPAYSVTVYTTNQ